MVLENQLVYNEKYFSRITIMVLRINENRNGNVKLLKTIMLMVGIDISLGIFPGIKTITELAKYENHYEIQLFPKTKIKWVKKGAFCA